MSLLVKGIILNFKTTVFAIFLGALAGCAAPPLSLTKEAQTKIDRLEGVLTIPQNNLDITVQATNPGAGGLLGALIAAGIDSARQSSAATAAAPMLETLRDYDFRTVMQGAANDALSKVEQIKIILPLRLELVASESVERIAFDKSTASAVLFCNVRYQFQSGNLIVTANAAIYPKGSSLKQFRGKPQDSDPLDRGNAIYRKTFIFSKQAVAASTIKADLTEAATNIARQLADDLNHGR